MKTLTLAPDTIAYLAEVEAKTGVKASQEIDRLVREERKRRARRTT